MEAGITTEAITDLLDHVIDDVGGFPPVEHLMRERAETAAGDRRVAEGMRKDPHEQPARGVVVQVRVNPAMAIKLLVPGHGGCQRITVQQPVSLWPLHQAAEQLPVVSGRRRGVKVEHFNKQVHEETP